MQIIVAFIYLLNFVGMKETQNIQQELINKTCLFIILLKIFVFSFAVNL